MRKRAINLVGAFLSAALLTACGGSQPPVAPPTVQAGSISNGFASRNRDAAGYRVVYSFGKDAKDGLNPSAALIDVNGTLYGITPYGGTKGCTNICGTVFSVSATGTERVVHRFCHYCADGDEPFASLINVKGTLYGTTAEGGKENQGTVFSVSTTGTESVLYSFCPTYGCPDGSTPEASLIDVNGTLYGTTKLGGKGSGALCNYGGCGTVFSVSATGTEHVLHNFKGKDGAIPDAGLVDVNGTLYGTTSEGGAHSRGSGDAGGGIVFSVSTTGANFRVLHSFGAKNDGYAPMAGLIDVNGTLYGTTSGGGVNNGSGEGCDESGINTGCGTVFRVSTAGVEHVIYSFGSSATDGTDPLAALIDVNGTLYGTTTWTFNISSGGIGTVFSVSTTGKERVLHNFGKTKGDGSGPDASLIDVKGTLYGTTCCGGKYMPGTVFALTP